MNLKRIGEEEVLILAVKLPRHKLNKLAPCLEVQVSFINMQSLANQVDTPLTGNAASQIPGNPSVLALKNPKISHSEVEQSPQVYLLFQTKQTHCTVVVGQHSAMLTLPESKNTAVGPDASGRRGELEEATRDWKDEAEFSCASSPVADSTRRPHEGEDIANYLNSTSNYTSKVNSIFKICVLT